MIVWHEHESCAFLLSVVRVNNVHSSHYSIECSFPAIINVKIEGSAFLFKKKSIIQVISFEACTCSVLKQVE